MTTLKHEQVDIIEELLRKYEGWDDLESYSMVRVLSSNLVQIPHLLLLLQKATQAKLVVVTKGGYLELIDWQAREV